MQEHLGIDKTLQPMRGGLANNNLKFKGDWYTHKIDKRSSR